MPDYADALKECLEKVVEDDNASDDQKSHAKALLDSYASDPPEGSGN